MQRISGQQIMLGDNILAHGPVWRVTTNENLNILTSQFEHLIKDVYIDYNEEIKMDIFGLQGELMMFLMFQAIDLVLLKLKEQ